MTTYVLVNDLQTTLAAALTASGTSATVANTANLPSLASGQVMPLILNDAATRQIYEICYVTAISGSTLTIERGQEGTSALAWSIGDYCYCSSTASTVAVSTGNPNNTFQVADATQPGEAPNLGQLSGFYVPTGKDGSNVIDITSSSTLTGAQSGHQINCWQATGPLTLTLPAISKGINYLILPSSQTITVTSASSGNPIFQSDGTTSTSITLGGNAIDYLYITASDNGTVWRASQFGHTVVSSPRSGNQAVNLSYAQASFAALAGSASQIFSVGTATGAANATRLDQFSGSGFGSYDGVNKQAGSMYMTFANNASPTKRIIVQMGYVSGNNSGTKETVTFPIAFPNNVLTVSVTADASEYGNTNPVGLSTRSPNLNLGNMTLDGGISGTKKMAMFWIAVGY